MQHSLPTPLIRVGMLAAASSISALLMFAAPQAHAAANGGYYDVELAQPVEARREIVRGGVIACAGTRCTGTRANSRPAIICTLVAKEFGPVAAFSAGGKAFDAKQLAACNESA